METDLNKEVQIIQDQLREALVAEGGLNSAFGELLTKLFTAEITRLTRDVTSDKYRKDPVGYNNALSDLHAYRNILKKLQVAAHPQRIAKLREKLDDRKNV